MQKNNPSKESTGIFTPGDRVRLTHDVGSSYYDRNEIYISGTKGSLAVILTPEEFLLLDDNGSIYDLADVKEAMAGGVRYPVRYEKLMPISKAPHYGFEIIDHRRQAGTDYIYAVNLERME